MTRAFVHDLFSFKNLLCKSKIFFAIKSESAFIFKEKTGLKAPGSFIFSSK